MVNYQKTSHLSKHSTLRFCKAKGIPQQSHCRSTLKILVCYFLPLQQISLLTQLIDRLSHRLTDRPIHGPANGPTNRLTERTDKLTD